MNKTISMFLTDWALPFSIAYDEIQCSSCLSREKEISKKWKDVPAKKCKNLIQSQFISAKGVLKSHLNKRQKVKFNFIFDLFYPQNNVLSSKHKNDVLQVKHFDWEFFRFHSKSLWWAAGSPRWREVRNILTSSDMNHSQLVGIRRDPSVHKRRRKLLLYYNWTFLYWLLQKSSINTALKASHFRSTSREGLW